MLRRGLAKIQFTSYTDSSSGVEAEALKSKMGTLRRGLDNVRNLVLWKLFWLFLKIPLGIAAKIFCEKIAAKARPDRAKRKIFLYAVGELKVYPGVILEGIDIKYTATPNTNIPDIIKVIPGPN